MKDCQHKNTSFIHVHYTNPNSICEWTTKCKDCGKILGFSTNTVRLVPMLVGVNLE